jgi:hypothetical protein
MSQRVFTLIVSGTAIKCIGWYYLFQNKPAVALPVFFIGMIIFLMSLFEQNK